MAKIETLPTPAPAVETLPIETIEAPTVSDGKPAAFDFTAWADALPAVVVLSKDRPAYVNDAGQIVQAQCKLAGTEGEPCWGRVTSLDHPMARHPDGSTKDQSLAVHTCRGHFWQAQSHGPYVPLPKAYRKK